MCASGSFWLHTHAVCVAWNQERTKAEKKSWPDKSYKRSSLRSSTPGAANTGGNTISREPAVSLSKAFAPNLGSYFWKTQTLTHLNWLHRLTGVSIGTTWTESLKFSLISGSSLQFIRDPWICPARCQKCPPMSTSQSVFDHTLSLLNQHTKPRTAWGHDIEALAATGSVEVSVSCPVTSISSITRYAS